MGTSVDRPSTYDVLRWAESQTCGGPGPKAVLMTLARMAGLQPDGRWACFPSQSLIAEITEQSQRTVRSQLADLEAKGMIVRTKRSRHGVDVGRGRTTDLITIGYLPADVAAKSCDLPATHDRPTGNSRPTYRQPVAARNYQGTTREEKTSQSFSVPREDPVDNPSPWDDAPVEPWSAMPDFEELKSRVRGG